MVELHTHNQGPGSPGPAGGLPRPEVDGHAFRIPHPEPWHHHLGVFLGLVLSRPPLYHPPTDLHPTHPTTP